MKISELKNSRYLTKEDCDPPITVTIKGVKKENVAPADQKPEERYVLLFAEPGVRGLVLNSTNGALIAKYLGSDDSDDWTGKKIVLYHDPSVSFAGKLVGGIRVRKHEGETADVPW